MEKNHPIEGLMLTAMSSIREMIDVNTIIGEPIEALDGLVIIPISKVSFGFAAGGSEFNSETINQYTKRDKDEDIQYKLPFGGGAGAGASINPVAFLIVQNGNIKLMPVEHSSYTDKLLDYIPDLLDKFSSFMNKNIENKNERTEKIINQIKKSSKEIFNKEQQKNDFETKEFEDITQSNISPDNIEMYEPKPESDGEDF